MYYDYSLERFRMRRLAALGLAASVAVLVALAALVSLF